ncbi:MAG: prepilin-type N-terminal cleavage/methylation domain-containing protein [Candidatus Saccharimonadales bacterium]
MRRYGPLHISGRNSESNYSLAFTPTSLKLRRVKLALPAFTIVELLVVIVVIGILAAITIGHITVLLKELL